jgi:hypothetical protein
MIKMRHVLLKHILYWFVAVIALWGFFLIFGYRGAKSVISALTILPGATLMYFCMRNNKNDLQWSLRNVLPILACGILSLCLLFLVQYIVFYSRKTYDLIGYPALMTHPLFILSIAVLLPMGDFVLWRRGGAPCESPPGADEEPMNYEVKVGRELVSVADISFIRSSDTFTVVVTKDGAEYQNYIPISKWEQELSSRGFVRIHRSYLVNKLTISKVNPRSVTLESGQELPVSRTYQASVQLLLAKHFQD